MGRLEPVHGEGFECRHYAGSEAEAIFGDDTLAPQEIATGSGENKLIYFHRFERGHLEAGIFLYPDALKEPCEVLCFLSADESADRAAKQLFDKLVQRLGYKKKRPRNTDLSSSGP